MALMRPGISPPDPGTRLYIIVTSALLLSNPYESAMGPAQFGQCSVVAFRCDGHAKLQVFVE
jgi:hypothetical protein